MRLLCLALSIVMLIGLMPTTVLAADTYTVSFAANGALRLWAIILFVGSLGVAAVALFSKKRISFK